MSDRLSQLRAPVGANTPKTRAGRGVGSGLGKTAGRGQKGQKARSTGQMGRLGFQGGQTPLTRRLPKRGFRKFDRAVTAEVNVEALNAFDVDSVVDIATLRASGLVKGQCDVVKILGQGDLVKRLVVRVDGLSKTAEQKILAAGGTVERLRPSTST